MWPTTFAMLLALAAFPSRAETPPTTEELIAKLASGKFAERERAAKAVRDIGPAALPALRKAAGHVDAEVKQRVGELIAALELVAALEPKRVTLGDERCTVATALEEIKRQTGYAITAEAAAGSEYRFGVKGATFWEAVERVRRESGRILRKSSPGGVHLALERDKGSAVVSFDGSFRVEATTFHEDRDIDFRERGDGKESGRRDHILTLSLDVAVEPRFVLIAADRAVVEVAEDEVGKPLPPAKPPSKEVGGLWEREPSFPKPFRPESVVLLRRSSERAKSMKELRGVVPVRVVVERKRIVVTETVAKSKGAAFRIGKDSLRVTHAETEKDGTFRLKVALPSTEGPVGRSWPDCIRVEDADGNAIKPTSFGTEQFGENYWLMLGYPPSGDPKVGPPLKLIVEDWVVRDVNVRFAFKDVPLP